MLTIATVRDRSGAYYLAGLRQEHSVFEDRLGNGAESARWQGRGIDELGLTGPVTGEAMQSLLATGSHGKGLPVSVAAFDLTFSAPKSVSILYAFGDHETARGVAEAHRQSVEAATRYVEGHAASARRGSGPDRQVVGVDGIAAAAFDHSTSRALDPHLHTHVLVANEARGPDGRRSALDGRGLFAHREAASEIYALQLRHELTRTLGVTWRMTPTGHHEVEGIGPEAIGVFSSRRAEIRGHLHEHGGSGRSAQIAWAATRDQKTDLDVSAIRELWERRARAVGLEMSDRRPRPDLVRTEEPVLDERRFSSLVVTSPHASVGRRDALAAWCSSVRDGVGADVAEAALDRWIPEGAGGVGVAEVRFGPGRVVPPRHLVSLLGPRPLRLEAHDQWRRAAQSVLDYRARWGVTDGRRSLGADRSSAALAELPTRRLAQHLDLVRVADELRQHSRGFERQERSRGR